MYDGLILQRQPKPAYPLILANEVSPLDPKRRSLGWMSGDLHDGEILSVNPNCAFEEIFVLPLRGRLNHKAVVRSGLFFAEQLKRIVGGCDGAVVMFFSGCCVCFTFDQSFEDHVANQA